jgi:hypothetical protein
VIKPYHYEIDKASRNTGSKILNKYSSKNMMTGKVSSSNNIPVEPFRSLKQVYDISTITIENIELQDSDFLVKFIEVNHQDIRELKFKKVRFAKDASGFVGVLIEKRPHIRSISYEDVNFGETSFQMLIHSCQLCPSLEKLSFISMRYLL